MSQAPLDLTSVGNINHHVYQLIEQANGHGHAFAGVDLSTFDRGLHPHLEYSSHTPIQDGPSMHGNRHTLHDNHQMAMWQTIEINTRLSTQIVRSLAF